MPYTALCVKGYNLSAVVGRVRKRRDRQGMAPWVSANTLETESKELHLNIEMQLERMRGQ